MAGKTIISQPRRLLIVGDSTCNLAGLVKDLTGTAPNTDSSGSLAGSIHSWAISTNYYKANVPVWIDEISDLTQWQEDFLGPEAREVIQALGGWICCFKVGQAHSVSEDDLSRCRKLLQAVDSVIKKACGYDWEGVKLAVRISTSAQHSQGPASAQDDLEDVCMDFGFEYIDASAKGKNQYGERQGLDRISEAVEANEWQDLGNEEIDEELTGDFATEEAEMDAELFDLKASLATHSEPGDDHDEEHLQQPGQVDDLDRLMQQALAIKERTAHMSPEERKRFAAKAINQLMDTHAM